MRPIPSDSDLPPGVFLPPPGSPLVASQRLVPTGSTGASWLWGTVFGVVAGLLAAVLSAVGFLSGVLFRRDPPEIGWFVTLGAPWVGALALACGAGFFAGFLSKRLSSGVLAGVLSGIPSAMMTSLMSAAMFIVVLNIDLDPPGQQRYAAIATVVVIGATAGAGALGAWAGRSFARWCDGRDALWRG